MSAIAEIVGHFFDLAAEAERIDADLNGDAEPAMEAVLLHVLAHPQARRELAEAFLEVARDPNKGPPQLVQYCMHALRWSEVKQELVRRLETEQSERVRHVLRKLLMSFDDDWYDADAYARFNNEKN